MRFAGSVTLRPVRLGFLVPPDDFGLVRRVARLCSCLWGGRYNPIIPFFEDVRSRWIASHHRAEGSDVARGYIDFFEPDVLVEATAGMAARLGWNDKGSYFRLPRVVPLNKFYEVDDRGRVGFAAGIDITNVVQHLYDQEYKYQRRHKIPYANQSRARFESATASVAHTIVAASNPEREVSQTHWNGMMAAFGKKAHIQAAPAPTATLAIRLPA